MVKLYSVEDVAEMLDVSVSAVRKWVLEKRITYMKIGKLVRFSEENVNEFIKRRSR